MSLSAELAELWEGCAEAVAPTQRDPQRPWRHLLAQLVCLGRHSITKLLCTCGRTQEDWSADYRLYSRERLDADRVFTHLLGELLHELPAEAPLVVAMDDSLLRRSGRKVHGVAYRRDPLSPPFQANLILGQRVLELAASLPLGQDLYRSIPLVFRHTPTPLRPPAKASPEQQQAYAEARRESTMGRCGARELAQLRGQLPPERPLHAVVDGRFTVSTLLQNLPEGSTLIGRIRKDAKLYYPPSRQAARGRPRNYGAQAPTPLQFRADERIPYQTISLRHQGETLQFRVKHIAPLKWRPAGPQRFLSLLIVAPVCYRRRPGGKPLYRQPAYLICTDPRLAPEQILREYLQRWDIEVNFRDQKTLLGLGQAQVRSPQANQQVPAFAVAAYAMLLLASARYTRDNPQAFPIPRPRWQRQAPCRPSTAQLINQLRCECFAQLIEGGNFSGFTPSSTSKHKPWKLPIDPQAAIAYATTG